MSKMLSELRKIEASLERVADSKSEIVKDVMGLSSGTLATLTGKKEYAYLDKVHQKFIQFVVGALDSDPKAYKNWKDAWKYFTESYDLDSLRVKQGSNRDAIFSAAEKVRGDVKSIENSLEDLATATEASAKALNTKLRELPYNDAAVSQALLTYGSSGTVSGVWRDISKSLLKLAKEAKDKAEWYEKAFRSN